MSGSLSVQGFMCSAFAFWVYSVSSSSFVLRTPILRQVRLFQFSVSELALALFWPCWEAVPLFLEGLPCSFNTSPLRLLFVTFYYRSSLNLSRHDFRKALSAHICQCLRFPVAREAEGPAHFMSFGPGSWQTLNAGTQIHPPFPV